MTKIDFHILPTKQAAERLTYVARLAQKALKQNLQVLICADSAEATQAISNALWAAIPESFLAHRLIQEPHYSLQIGTTDECGEHHQVLINLASSIPTYFSRFERVFEVVTQQPEILPVTRQHYRYYADHGYSISRHDLRLQV